eukprot:gene10721-12470_t
MRSCKAVLHMDDSYELQTLHPDVEQRDVIILPHDEPLPNKNKLRTSFDKDRTLFYMLNDLLPNTLYSIRISHTASSPADFRISLYNDVVAATSPEKKANHRELLNTEMFKFKTDQYAVPITNHGGAGGICTVAVIEAVNTGVTPSLNKDDKNRLVSFNLVMDTESIGVPPEIPRLVIIILVSVVVCAFFIVKRMFPQMKGFQLLV